MMLVKMLVALWVGSVLCVPDEPQEGLIHRLDSDVAPTAFEEVAPKEADLILEIVRATGAQMAQRYAKDKKVLRNQHAKSHGCVAARFTVLHDIPQQYRVGLFSEPKSYDAIVRFSNASSRVGPDSRESPEGVQIHGSRGMAIKVLGVSGESILPLHGALTQDFVMINSPVFAFANVEDYALLSKSIAEHGDEKGPAMFFAARQTPDTTPEQLERAKLTGEIAARIQSSGNPPPFQKPPAHPVQNKYFGAAPFLFGPNHAMRYRVTPIGEGFAEAIDVSKDDYLRDGLSERLGAGKTIRFVFEAQIRSKEEITDIGQQIENACLDWETEGEASCWIRLADLEITASKPLDEAVCESLIFTPWHCLREHQPLGSINRLRKAVYQASAMIRSTPKEPNVLPE